MGIAIANISPPPKSINTKVTTAKGSQHYPKIHLSVHISTPAPQKPPVSSFSLSFSSAPPPQPSVSIPHKFTPHILPSPHPSASFSQKFASPLHPSTVHVIPPHNTSLLLRKYTSSLYLSVINAPHPLLAVLIQWREGPSPTPSTVRAYALLILVLIPRQFYPPLQTSNLPSPLPHI